MPPLLQLDEVDVFHGDLQAVFGVSLRVEAGEALALIGANGAGKSTLLRAITGLTPARRGTLCVDGQMLGGLSAERIAALGIALVPEGRQLFPSLSVEENLLMGAFARRPGPWNLKRLFALFPILESKRRHPATALSGGQQQMVAIGRALMGNPDVLLCDELSLGLAPIVIKEIYDAVPPLTHAGMSLVIVEQDVSVAQRVSQRVVCFQEGRVSLQGASAALTREQISRAYFGV